ncbi:formyl-CoA transferase [Tamaricihabitans halophyticus]|uniref:Formyl-CoA transferase n=1 Tax=Tamaricihabitans halophyticus TaxID=1262583 RepID=A0A4V2SS21_9PSEU|nr:CoA transferase [Tamaricihabitans halophyticus]TCP45046.1 formyl-CoA transferase [Tamaricihabitans halophyticus]
MLSKTGPLKGVRVLDLTAMLAGPYTTMLLADLGAEVVKVEPPDGDLTRYAGPFRADDTEDGLAGYFQSVNRGKRSLVLNLREERSRQQLLDLVGRAAVLVENFSAGVMERLGLGYEELREHNPALVYAALRGFGDRRSGASPYADWPAFDVVAQAMGGYLSITGTEDGTPVKSGPGVGDIFPGALLAVGIVSALRHAERTGEGQFVDVAMYDAMVSLSERAVHQYSYTGVSPGTVGNQHPLLYPFGIFRTADGWIALAANRDHHWQLTAAAMGRPELADDPRFSTNTARSEHRGELAPILSGWLRSQTNAALVTLLGGRVPIGPVHSAADLFRDPHLSNRQMLLALEQPGSEQPVTVAGQPLKFSGTPYGTPERAPLLGEDSFPAVLAAWSEGNSEEQT